MPWSRLGVQPLDQRISSRLCRPAGRNRANADLLAGAALVAHIDGGRRVVADEHDREPRRGLPARRAAPRAERLEQFVGDAFAVEDARVICAASCRRGAA